MENSDPAQEQGQPPPRQQSLQRRIRFLDQRLARLASISLRYTWYRVIVFCLGFGGTALAWFYLPRNQTWLIFGLFLSGFIVVVIFHRRLDRWIEIYKIWREQRASQLARLELDWERLPLPELQERVRNALDIDLDLTGPRSLHTLLDISISQEGSQRLADWLIHSLPDLAQIEARQQAASELAHMPRFYERLLLELKLISKDQLRGRQLLEWLKIEMPTRRLKWLLVIAFILTTTNLILFVLNSRGILPAYWVFSMLISLAFYYFNAGSISIIMEAITGLDHELGKFSVLLRYIETYPMGGAEHLTSLCAPYRQEVSRPSTHLRRIRWVTAGVGLRSNPLLAILLNVFLPWDYLFAYLAGQIQTSAARLLPDWLEGLYQLDALCSLGNFANLHPGYTFPKIAHGSSPVFEAARLGHPLIPAARRVCNDFCIASLGEVVIITGSNMSGKSTFIKTIGVNLCLAYAGAPVCADLMHMQPFRLHSCMRISDSIADGFSYFYAEVKCLRALLSEIQETVAEPLLYLVDEIFRGTNNRERLQGSRAYTKALIGLHGAGMIATHDLELAHLADAHAQVSNYHFRDEVQGGRLIFDYTIQPGSSPTTNALKIMAMEGLPVDETDL